MEKNITPETEVRTERAKNRHFAHRTDRLCSARFY